MSYCTILAAHFMCLLSLMLCFLLLLVCCYLLLRLGGPKKGFGMSCLCFCDLVLTQFVFQIVVAVKVWRWPLVLEMWLR